MRIWCFFMAFYILSLNVMGCSCSDAKMVSDFGTEIRSHQSDNNQMFVPHFVDVPAVAYIAPSRIFLYHFFMMLSHTSH